VYRLFLGRRRVDVCEQRRVGSHPAVTGAAER
jgi:hypothetical protein